MLLRPRSAHGLTHPAILSPIVLLLLSALLAWQEPSLATANRMVRSTKAPSQKTSTVKAQVKAKAINQTSRIRRAGKAGAAHLNLRAAVRSQSKASQTALKNGQLASAATEISRSPLRNAKGQFVKGPTKVSFRERFAIWRATRAVKGSALRLAGERSAKGDMAGTADALDALTVLEGKGKLGVLGRWQKARATRKAFRNIKSAASRSLQSGDVDAAGQSFMFATGIRPGSRAATKMSKQLVSESFKLANTYSKAGQPELAWKVLEMGAAIAHEGGTKFNDKKAKKLVDASFKTALPRLTKAAGDAYKSGDLEQATALLAESRAIQRSGHAQASRSVRRQQARLLSRLGPTLAQFEAAQAQPQGLAAQ